MNMYKKILKIYLVSFLSIFLSACGDSDADNYDKNKAGLIEALKDPDVAKAVYEASRSISAEVNEADMEMKSKKTPEDNKNDYDSSMLKKYGTIAAYSMASELNSIDGIAKKIDKSNGEYELSSEYMELAHKIVRDELLKEEDEKRNFEQSGILKIYGKSDFMGDKFRENMSAIGKSDDVASVVAMTAIYIIETGRNSIDSIQKETINKLVDNGKYDVALAIVDVYGKASFFQNKHFVLDPERSMKISGWLKKEYSSVCFESYEGCAIVANAVGDQYFKKAMYDDAYFFYGLATIKAKSIEGFDNNEYGEKVFLMLNHLGCTQDRDVWGDFVLYRDGQVMTNGEILFKGIPYPDVKYKNNINIYAERISLARNNRVPNLSQECIKHISI